MNTLVDKYNQHIKGRLRRKEDTAIKDAIEYYDGQQSITMAQWVNRKGISRLSLRNLESAGMVSDYPYFPSGLSMRAHNVIENIGIAVDAELVKDWIAKNPKQLQRRRQCGLKTATEIMKWCGMG